MTNVGEEAEREEVEGNPKGVLTKRGRRAGGEEVRRSVARGPSSDPAGSDQQRKKNITKNNDGLDFLDDSQLV
jgi:hypothetical protein